MSTPQGPNESWRYPGPGQPIPPPAPGPTSPLSAIFARSATFVLMGLTAIWTLVLFTGVFLRSAASEVSEMAGPQEVLPDPTLALAGCGGGFLIWVSGLATCWRKPIQWAWTAAGAVAVIGMAIGNAVAYLI